MSTLSIRDKLSHFIKNKSFPCVMAKALLMKGNLCIYSKKSFDDQNIFKDTLKDFYSFIDLYRLNTEKLSSFILTFDDPEYEDFDVFEKKFWGFLKTLGDIDKTDHPHDPRVSSDPTDPNYGFSIKSEAFFILLLHPKSPRFARRFFKPSIVFNPHLQFENLRKNGSFNRVRNIIRGRDKVLQGSENPMLQDFGERSEIFQYTGKVYDKDLLSPVPLTA